VRILVHDYSGHPFQVQLSRALAWRGHTVLHLHAAFFQTPKGRLARTAEDPPGFAVEGLELGEPFAKYRFFARRAQEQAYGAIVAGRAAAWRPDLVLCANMPLDPLAGLAAWCRRARVPFVFWIQDIYSLAIDRLLRRRLGPLGAAIGAYYRRLEARVARESAALVAITEDFRPTLEGWGVAADRIFVIENWAPLDELPTHKRDNGWSREHGLADKLTLLYTGTLGLKHNPALLTALAERFRADPRVAVVVVSEGPGADWLAAAKLRRRLDNLHLLPFQPYARLPDVMASGDLLLAILEPEAGVFAVPSKVLSYFCAGRPLLAAIPRANLAARLIEREEAGLVVDPADEAGFVAAAERLIGEPARRAAMGKNALDYARETFDIGAVVERFETVFAHAAGGGA
jgi:colanic acid biosynthesis glycosyl transferase WcaI